MVRRVLAGALALIVAVGFVPASEVGAAADDPPPALTCPAPLPGPRAVVQLAFMVLLRRCPDPAGATAWETSLRDGLVTETFARRIAATPEARGVVVADAYRMVLGRTPSAAERTFWAGWLRPPGAGPRRHDQLLAELAASRELWVATDRDPATFVATIYERVLGRAAQPAETDYWVDRLVRRGDSRRVLVRTLLRLPEPLGATVTAAWVEVLGVAPTPAQRRWESARLRNDGDRLGLSARLVGSDAFAARAQARALVVPGRYVALGDSFVVGEGNPPWVEDDTGCGYTTSAYPEVARTSSELVPSDLDVAACTGSPLLDLYPYEDGGDGFRLAGQLDRLAEGETPDLVTLTIGGEDIGMVSLVQACLQVQVDGAGQYSPYYDREQCDDLLDTDAPAAIEALRTGRDEPSGPGEGYQCTEPCSLTSAITDIRAAAPEAEVVVVGYPQIMSSSSSSSSSAGSGGCRGPVMLDGRPSADLEWYVPSADVARGREVLDGLNGALRDAATAAGATFVDLAAAYAGHEACSAEPWINGTLLSAEGFPEYGSYHPNRRGAVATASALTAALQP